MAYLFALPRTPLQTLRARSKLVNDRSKLPDSFPYSNAFRWCLVPVGITVDLVGRQESLESLEKDRTAVRNFATILKSAGYTIVRAPSKTFPRLRADELLLRPCCAPVNN
jgi:hypothetical protein